MGTDYFDRKNNFSPMDHSFFDAKSFLIEKIISRLDLTYAIKSVCQHMHMPRDINWLAVKRILRYLKGTIHFGLQLYRKNVHSIVAYCDTDGAAVRIQKGLLQVSIRYTIGFCVFIGHNLVSWASNKQYTMSRSSIEAQYRALATAVTEVYWFRFLLIDLKLFPKLHVEVYYDNISTTYTVINPINHTYTKHIEVDFHFVPERVTWGDIAVRFIPNTDELADMFTKGLSSEQFMKLRNDLSMTLHHQIAGA